MAGKEKMFSNDDDKLRKKNLATVKKYMAMCGSRLERHKLFTDDCTWGLAYSETGGPQYVSGIENVKKMDIWNTTCFPDWAWSNVKIYQTQDPNYFWVDCDGSGQAFFPDYPPVTHSCHFVHSFEMEDGKIKFYREFMNPVKELMDFGLKIPQLKRG
jgi:phenazine biosynthesis protein